MAKKMIIKGVGQFMAKKYAKDGSGQEVISLGTMQDLRITLNTEIDDIFGGDGLFAIDTLVRNKAVEISATDAKFDLHAVSVMMGSDVKNDVDDYVWVLNEKHEIGMQDGLTDKTYIDFTQNAAASGNVQLTIDGVATPYDIAVLINDSKETIALKVADFCQTNATISASFYAVAYGSRVIITSTDFAPHTMSIVAAGITNATVTAVREGLSTGYVANTIKLVNRYTVYKDHGLTVRVKDSNRLLTVIESTTATPANATECVYNPNTKVITFDASLNGQDVSVNYRKYEMVDLTEILTDEVPFPLHVVHHGSYLQKDGSFGNVETEIYSAMANGQFSIDAARAQASTSALALKVIDPERRDGKLASIKRWNTDKKV